MANALLVQICPIPFCIVLMVLSDHFLHVVCTIHGVYKCVYYSVFMYMVLGVDIMLCVCVCVCV